MGIVLNEYDWAEDMINARELGKSPLETLSRVSKYYIENGYSPKETRNLLDIFLVRCRPDAVLAHWDSALDKIVRSSAKHPLIRLEGISITDKELRRIDILSSCQAQRLAFTLLCVAKYWDAARATNNHWVNTADKEIMKMANINTSIKRQCLLFSDLRDADLVKFSKRIDNLNVQVTFTDDSGKEALYIQDFRNLGYQYMRRFGGNYFECEHCGLVEKEANPGVGRKQKYCKTCAAELNTKHRVNQIMRQDEIALRAV